MAMDGVIRFLGCVNLLAFFISDLYFAFVLSQLKRLHPSIDDCAPPMPSAAGGFDNNNNEDARSAERGYGHMRSEDDNRRPPSSSTRSSFASGAQQPQHVFQDTPNDPVSLIIDSAKNKQNGEIAALFNSLNPRDLIRSRSHGVYNDLDSRERGANGIEGEDSVTQQRQRLVHLVVIIASFAAPFFSLLQVLFPRAMRWSLFHVPSVIGYLATVPAFMLVVIYGSRAMRVGSFVEVSRAQWLSLAWFRLDVMLIMASLLLIGWGDWLVSLCLFIVGFYMALRLLQTERRLAEVIQATQLLGANGGRGAKGGGGYYEGGVVADGAVGLDENGGVVMGLKNGTGVVRSALIASEGLGAVVGGGKAHQQHLRSLGFEHPDDVFEGVVIAGGGGGSGRFASSSTSSQQQNYGGLSGSASTAVPPHHVGSPASMTGHEINSRGRGAAEASNSGSASRLDFASNNQPLTDSETEPSTHSRAAYNSLSAEEDVGKSSRKKRN